MKVRWQNKIIYSKIEKKNDLQEYKISISIFIYKIWKIVLCITSIIKKL